MQRFERLGLRPSLISAAEASGDGCRKSFGIEIPMTHENTKIFYCKLGWKFQLL